MIYTRLDSAFQLASITPMCYHLSPGECHWDMLLVLACLQVLPFLRILIGPRKPFNWLVRNKWYNTRIVASPHLSGIPLLLLVSELDEMVPPPQMYALENAIRKSHSSNQVIMVQFAGAHHMDAYDVSPVQYWTSLAGFLRDTCTLQQQEAASVAEGSAVAPAQVDAPSR